MLIELILTAATVGVIAARPRSTCVALAALGLALAAVPFSRDAAGAFRDTVATVVPLAVFLTAAMSLAAQASRSGLADRIAEGLARSSRGHSAVLYAGVCGLCTLLTWTVSLDGAVVLMVPVALALDKRFGAPFRPLFLATIAAANAASLALPQGNPTNLVLAQQLGLGPVAFTRHLLVPALAAMALVTGAIAFRERRALAGRFREPTAGRRPFSAAERHAALALAGTGVAAALAPAAGLAPWWPIAAVAGLGLVTAPLGGLGRPSLLLPGRIAVQVAALLLVVPAAVRSTGLTGVGGATLPALLAVAVGAGALAALGNNLPATSALAGLVAAGAAPYAALVGLSVGALATRHGSVATLIAYDLAGKRSEGSAAAYARAWAPRALAAVVAATAILWVLGAS